MNCTPLSKADALLRLLKRFDYSWDNLRFLDLLDKEDAALSVLICKAECACEWVGGWVNKNLQTSHPYGMPHA